MNSTYYYAIKAIFYKVVFNCKPRFKRFNISNYYFIKADIKLYDKDDFLIVEDRKSQ